MGGPAIVTRWPASQQPPRTRRMAVDLTCTHCSKRFTKRQRPPGENFFCSQACYHADQRDQRIVVICEQCSGKFSVTPSWAKPGRRRFCSTRCFGDSLRVSVERLFLAGRGPKTETGCIPWMGLKNHKGYGRIGNKAAHRIAYEIANGPIPKGLLVMHECDFPACVNHEHLFLGTNKDNMDDRDAKGRQASGERNGNSKLTVFQVAKIRAAYAAGGTTHQKLGDAYGVSKALIGAIVNFRVWQHTLEHGADGGHI